jgi:branched-subunit amino acid transport protein AzlD
MKKMNKFWSAAIIGAMLCLVMQSCASSRNKYGCPERIQALAELLPIK